MSLVAADDVVLVEAVGKVRVRADPAPVQFAERVDERAVVDGVDQVVVLFPDVGRIEIEHCILGVVLLEHLGPVEVLDDDIGEACAEPVENLVLVRVRLCLIRGLARPEPRWFSVLPASLRVA